MKKAQTLARLHLKSEGVAVEAAAAAALVCVLVTKSGVLTTLAWTGVCAASAFACLQALRLWVRRCAPEDHDVDLVGFNSRERSPAPWEVPNDEPAALFGTVLAAVAIPFVVAYVVVRAAMIYLIPTVAVLVGASVVEDVHPVRLVLVWVLAVGVAVANEFAVIIPYARRHGVEL